MHSAADRLLILTVMGLSRICKPALILDKRTLQMSPTSSFTCKAHIPMDVSSCRQALRTASCGAVSRRSETKATSLSPSECLCQMRPWHARTGALKSPGSGMGAPEKLLLYFSPVPVYLQQVELVLLTKYCINFKGNAHQLHMESCCALQCRTGNESPAVFLPCNLSTVSHSGCNILQFLRLESATASHMGTSTGTFGLNGPYAPCTSDQGMKVSQEGTKFIASS